MKMCRDQCPTAIASGMESFTPYIRSLHVNLNEKRIRSYDEGALDSIFSCLTCNLCNTFCLPKINEEELMKLARASIIDAGINVSKYSKISNSISKHHNPLEEAHQKRFESVQDLIKRKKTVDTLLFFGCIGLYREKEIARATIELLNKLGIDFTVMDDEYCCGAPAISTGFLQPALDVMNHNVKEWRELGIKNIIAFCSACYRTIKNTYPEHVPDFDFNVQHIIEVILARLKNLQLKELNSRVTYHDPCHLGRGMEIYDEPRDILNSIPGISLREMEHAREEGFCCGAGGGARSNFPDLAKDVVVIRVNEAKDIGVDLLISACPLCKYHIKNSENIGNIQVLDIVELVNQLLYF